MEIKIFFVPLQKFKIFTKNIFYFLDEENKKQTKK